MYKLIRSILFRVEPETAHLLTLQALRFAGIFPPSFSFLQLMYRAPARPVQAFGLTFKNPVGMAAGYDKDAVAIRGISSLGFGHLEVGTVTPKPQAGNPCPRVFRLLEDEAVINRIGFPSKGSEFVQLKLNPSLRSGFFERIYGIQPRKKTGIITSIHKGGAILGINLGKNKDTGGAYVQLQDPFPEAFAHQLLVAGGEYHLAPLSVDPKRDHSVLSEADL